MWGLMPFTLLVANWNHDYCFHWPQEPSLHKSYPSHTSQNISQAPKAVFFYFFNVFFAYLHSVFPFLPSQPLIPTFPPRFLPFRSLLFLRFFILFFFPPSVVSSSCQFLSPFFYSFSSFFSIFSCSLSSLFSALPHPMRKFPSDLYMPKAYFTYFFKTNNFTVCSENINWYLW